LNRTPPGKSLIVGAPLDPNTRTAAQVQAWGSKLRGFVERGGNLVLTDGAVRNLAHMRVVARSAINTFSVYAGYIGFTRGSRTRTTIPSPRT
jgi:hypothetical protein